MSCTLHREPVLLRAIFTTAGICSVSLLAILNSAASESCRTVWLGLECISWYVSIILVLPIACILLWYGVARDDRTELISRLYASPLGSVPTSAVLSIGCALTAWATLLAISTSCSPTRWGFDCSSHLVGALILCCLAIGFGIATLAAAYRSLRSRSLDSSRLRPLIHRRH